MKTHPGSMGFAGGLLLLAVIAGSAGFASPASAQQANRNNLTIVVPYPAGGGNDLFARLMAPRMGASLGRQAIVDNRTGASGNIGTAAVVRAAPDGNTLLYAASTIAINNWVFKDLGFDTVRDLKAVAVTISSPLVLVVHPSLPITDARSFIALARSRPGQISFSSGGAGSAVRFAMEAFKLAAKIDLRHIPYRGAGPALTAVVSGETESAFLVPSIVLPHLQAGKLRALGISSKTPVKILPNLPPLDGAGAPGFRAQQWHGFFVPAATPAETVGRLYAAVSGALNTEEMAERIDAAGAVKLGLNPSDSQAFFLDDIRYWGDVVKRVKLDP